jgi:predicted dehydrogenase
MWPHHPRTRQLRDLLDSGAIGQVRLVKGAFTFSLEMNPANIRLHAESAGGSLLDVGCYPVFGIRWAFGAEPVSAVAVANMQNRVDLSVNGLLRFAGGQVAEFDCGFTLPFRGWLEIVGTSGAIRVPEIWLPGPRAEYYVQRGERSIEEFTVPGHDQIQCMLEDFADAAFAGRDANPNPDEAVRTLKVLDALARSAREGRETAV